MHRTGVPREVFEIIGRLALTLMLFCVCGCPPVRNGPSGEQPVGTYMVSPNKLYGDAEDFDIRATAIYPVRRREGLQNPGTGVPDQDLTMYRCTWCHECGFEAAWDWAHYGSAEWEPQYSGEEWGPVVQRMMAKENSMLQEEQIARRIYNYLRDASSGAYDVMTDSDEASAAALDAPATAAEEGSTSGEGDQ